MQVVFVKSRWRRVLAIIVTALAIIIPILVGKANGWLPQILFIMSAFMGMVTPFALCTHLKVTKWWGLLLEQGTLAFFGLYLLHLPVMEGRILTPAAFAVNGMIALFILFLMQAIFAGPKKTGLVWITVCWVYGLLNACIMQFRGCVIILNDLYSIQTAINVAGTYTPEIRPAMIVSTYVYICVMANIIRSKTDMPSLKSKRSRIVSALIAAVMIIYPLVRLENTSAQIWGRNGPKKNGVLMEFLCELNSLSVKPPEEYSAEKVCERIKPYIEEVPAEEAVSGNEDNPHIIVVMSESFSDLSVLGLKANKEVNPYYKEVSESTLHGYLLASVYGGNTANSEWELLTGNTMAFMPGGSVPYRQYADDEHIHSLVGILKDQNYECVAMHPYNASGWSRTKVYPAMGFDEMYFLEDMEWGEVVREYVSDEAFVRQIINRFENHNSDKKLFLFGISMQNHGSYTFHDFESEVTIEGLKGNYRKTEQYLGLMHTTDDSIRQMIEYFDSVDEKVIILFFGDHQPRLESDLYDELGVKNEQLKQLVPFFIWSNYKDLSGEIPVTSLNYLSPMLLEIAGLESTDYFNFLLDFQKTVPAINPLGYYYNGKARDIEDIDPDVKELLNSYHILQYANVFDEEADEKHFSVQE